MTLLFQRDWLTLASFSSSARINECELHNSHTQASFVETAEGVYLFFAGNEDTAVFICFEHAGSLSSKVSEMARITSPLPLIANENRASARVGPRANEMLDRTPLTE